MNIGELTGYVGLDIDELQRNARRGEQDINSLANRVLAEARRVENERLKVKLDADASQAEREIGQLERRLDEIRARPAEARVDGDTIEVEEKLARLRLQLAQINTQRVKVRVDVDDNGTKKAKVSAEQLIGAFDKSAMAALLLGGGAPGIAALGSALISAVAAAAILPSALGAAAAVIGTLATGFGGVGDALSALGQQDQASAGASSGAGAQRAAALERVRSATEALQRAQESEQRTAITSAYQIVDAQDAVAQAVRAAARDAAQGARDIADAQSAMADAVAAAADRVASGEESIARAQRSAAAAQQDLTRAREDAKKKLEDLALALAGGALNEEAANLRLLKAQQALKRAGTNKNSLAYKEAELGVRQAAQAVEEAKNRYTDLQQESAEANAKGVDGADNVVAAQQRVNDANQQVIDSQKALDKARVDGDKAVAAAAQRLSDVQAAVAQRAADDAAAVAAAKEQLRRTEESVAWARADAAQAVADAQRDLDQAIQATSQSAGGGAGGVDKYAAALAKLAPNARAFVQELARLKPVWDAIQRDVQNRLFAGTAEEIRALAGIYLPLLHTMLGSVADSFNSAFHDVSNLLQTKEATDQVSRGFDNISKAVDIFSQALEPLTAIFLDLFDVGSEFLPGLADGFLNGVNAARSFFDEAARSGELKVWIQDALDTLGQLWDILMNVGGIIGGIFGAGQESGSGFLQFLVDVTGALNEFVNTPGTQAFLTGLFEVFTALAPTLLELAAAFKIASIAVGIFNAISALTSWELLIIGIIALVVLIVTNWDKIVAYTQFMWDTICAGVTAFWNWIKGIFTGALAWLDATWTQGWNTLGQANDAFWKMIGDTITGAWNWLKNTFSAGVAAIVNFLSTGWNNLVNITRTAWNNFMQTIANTVNSVLNFVRGIPGNILSALGNLGTLLWNAGRDIILGLWNGIQAMGGWLRDSILGFIRSFVPGPVLQFLGIASPSKLFHKIGHWIPAGLGGGIIASASLAADAARTMAADAATAARDTAAAELAVGVGDIARIEAYANTGRDPMTPTGPPPREQDVVGSGPRTVINVNNPQAERASDTLNRKARTLEALGVI